MIFMAFCHNGGILYWLYHDFVTITGISARIFDVIASDVKFPDTHIRCVHMHVSQVKIAVIQLVHRNERRKANKRIKRERERERWGGKKKRSMHISETCNETRGNAYDSRAFGTYEANRFLMNAQNIQPSDSCAEINLGTNQFTENVRRQIIIWKEIKLQRQRIKKLLRLACTQMKRTCHQQDTVQRTVHAADG